MSQKETVTLKQKTPKEEVLLVGVPGFEPGTSRTRTVRSSRAEPHPERT
jgi:hypothetical protein